MAFLGINNYSPELDGLYHFIAISKCEEISQFFTDSCMYNERDKKRALQDFGLTSNDIKDGRILMDYLRDNKLDRSYLVVIGTPFEGAYFFKQRAVRDREAQKFENTFVTQNKKEVMEKFNIGESAIRNGGYLLHEDVQNWLKKQAKAKEKAQAKAETEVQKVNKVENDELSTTPNIKEVVEVDIENFNGDSSPIEKKEVSKVVVPSVNQKSTNDNILRSIIEILSNTFDVIEVEMSNGQKYRLALRSLFYTENDFTFANCAYTDASGNVILKENMVDKWVENGDITIVEASKIKYGNGFAILRKCDDGYSPTVVFDKHGRKQIIHEIPEVIINVNQIVSVVGANGYTELNMQTLTSDKQKLIYDYLVSKYVKKHK